VKELKPKSSLDFMLEKFLPINSTPGRFNIKNYFGGGGGGLLVIL